MKATKTLKPISFDELKEMGYIIENVDRINRAYRIKNERGDLIATAFKESGLVLLQRGKIFNYKLNLETWLKGIKQSNYAAEIKTELLEICEAFKLGEFVGSLSHEPSSKVEGYVFTEFETTTGIYGHYFRIKTP